MLDIERVTVVGHSLGGGVAMQFAYQYPQRCERLVLVSQRRHRRATSPRAATRDPAVGAELLMLLPARPADAAVAPASVCCAALDTDLGVDARDLAGSFDALPDSHSRQAFARTLRAVVDWHGQVVTMLDRCYLASACRCC